MKRTRVEVNEERRILAGLITSTPFLKELRTVIDPSLFEANYCRLVCEWVFDFYDRISEAPGQAIEDIYLRNRHTIKDEDDLDTVASFLRRLSEDWDHKHIHSVEYSADQAVNYFKGQSLKKLSAEIQRGVDAGKPDVVETLIAQYRRVERLTSSGTRMLFDAATLRKAFTEDDTVLFKLPGDFGTLVGPVRRGDFIAFAAPPKRGKTFNMIDFACAGLSSNLKVLIFNLEMSHLQYVSRVWKNISGQASTDTTIQSWTYDSRAEELEPLERHFPKVDLGSNLEETMRTARLYYRGGDLRVLSFPPSTASVATLNSELDKLEAFENYIPDLILVDYADLLVPDKPTEYRHQLNEIWLGLRSLALTKDIAIVTGSQQNKQSMKGEGDETNIAEDYRKLAHVTKLFVLNQSKVEKRLGLMRVSMPIAREDAPDHGEVVLVQGLAAGSSTLESVFRSRIRNYDGITQATDDGED